MKKILSLLLFALPLFAAAQVVTLDTIFQQNVNGVFFEVRRTEYANGEYAETRKVVGDTMTIFNNYLQVFERQGVQMANDAYAVFRFPEIFDGLQQRRVEVLAATGKDLLDTLAVKYSVPLLIGGWTATEGAVTANVTFTVTAGAQLRYLVNGQAERNAFIVSNTMRLANWKGTGLNLDVFRAPGGNWFSIDGRVRIKFPGNQGLD